VERQLAALTLNRMPQDEISLESRALWSGIHGIAILRINSQLQPEGQHSITPLMEHLISRYLASFEVQEGDGKQFHQQVI
jgi:hypothetical protein